MIINLSSNGQSNHAHFTNQFTDNIIIKPNSKICLTRVSLVRDGKQTKVTIPAGTTMSFRYTPYDVITKIINVTETTYTAETLTTRLNTLFGGLISFNYTFEARATDTGDNIEIEFTSFLDNDAWINTNLVDYVFTNGDKARKMNTGAARLITGGLVPTGTINSSLETRSVLWETSVQTNGFGAKWGNNFTPIPIQTNKNAYNMYCSGGDQRGSSYITVVNPTFSSLQEIRIGRAIYNDDTDDYQLLPIPGNLFNESWYFRLSIGASNNNSLRNGDVVCYMYNNQTEAREAVANGSQWFCGDTFEIYVDPVVPVGVESKEEIFTFNVKQHSRDGLIGYIPSSLSGTKYWNVEEPAYMSPADYWQKYGLDVEALENLWDGNKMYGSRLGIGIRDIEIVKENVQYVTSFAVGTTTPIEYSPVAAGLRGVGNFPFYRAYTATAPVSDTADIGCHLVIGGGLPVVNVPTLITFIFQLQDKTAFTAETERTLISGSTAQTIRIDTAGGAYDLQLVEADSTVHQVTLLDNTATRIVFNLTSNYFFSLKSYGFSINPQVDITITDLDTNTDYTATITMTGTGLDQLLYVGGDPITDDNENFLHGYLGEVRFYQKPADITGDIAYWNNRVDYLKAYYNNTGIDESVKAYFGATRLNDIYTLSEPQYGNYGTSNTNKTMTPCVCRDTGDTIFDVNGYNFSDIFFMPQMTMPDDNRDTTLTNVFSYEGSGMGIVSSSGLNTILDIKDYDTATDTVIKQQERGTTQDTFEDPIFSTTSGVEQIDIDDKIFNIQIKNLPHRNYNGSISNFDKTIYQIGSLVNGKTFEDKRIIEVYPPVKVETELENAGDIVLNQLEVMITDETNKVETDLKANTNLTLEIK